MKEIHTKMIIINKSKVALNDDEFNNIICTLDSINKDDYFVSIIPTLNGTREYFVAITILKESCLEIEQLCDEITFLLKNNGYKTVIENTKFFLGNELYRLYIEQSDIYNV